jgi:hypothetical protein
MWSIFLGAGGLLWNQVYFKVFDFEKNNLNFILKNKKVDNLCS